MKEIIESTISKVNEVDELNYTDENWGQLDFYHSTPPVQWPCALIDVQSGKYSNLGKDRRQTPQNRQIGGIRVELRIANYRLGNTSTNAPQAQKDNVWSIWGIIEKIHEKLHGFSPASNCTALIRETHARVLREDGVQEYIVIYSAQLNDI